MDGGPRSSSDGLEVVCDVLVVGGGAAGCLAAIGARQKGADVVLAEKGGSITRSGNLASGIDHYIAVLGEAPWDTPEGFLANLEEVNEYLVDMELAGVFAREVAAMVRYLESIGVPFRDKETGRYRRVPGLSSQKPRLINLEGADVKKLLAREVHRLGVKVVERMAVHDLLTNGQETVGAVGVGVRSGTFHVFRAKAVVLTTGGVVRLYPTPSGLTFMSHHCPYNTGDGQAMAFRAGAELTNMEFTYCSIVPKDFSTAGISGLVGLGARIINALGERYMEKYHPWGEKAPRNAVVWGTVQEIKNGRGPCYVDCTHLPPEIIGLIKLGIQNEKATTLDFLEAKGIDLGRDPLEFEPQEFDLGVSFAFGAGSGILIDKTCATNIEGLFAAGDCTHFSFGATSANTLGYRAGQEAAKYAGLCSTVPSPAEKHLAEHRDRLLAPINRKEGISHHELEEKLRRTMARYVGFGRNARGLETALKSLQTMKGDRQKLLASNPHELLRSLESQNLVDVAETVVTAALERKESRAVPCHYRADFPERDDENWKKFLVIKKEDGMTGIKCRSTLHEDGSG